jgi:CTP:molybdopterin cytidylyltransferase MocA
LRARRTELPYERRDYCLAYDPTFTARFVTTPLNVAILAAGQGKRMYSSLPKVLHPLAGRPLVAYVVDTARALAPRAITIVTGQGSDAVAAALAAPDLAFVVQDPPRGTGDATRSLHHAGRRRDAGRVGDGRSPLRPIYCDRRS